jgi:hypothetical protein
MSNSTSPSVASSSISGALVTTAVSVDGMPTLPASLIGVGSANWISPANVIDDDSACRVTGMVIRDATGGRRSWAASAGDCS